MPPSDDDLETILERIHQKRNFDFRNYKRATLRRRVERRMQDRKCRSAREYLALLDREPDEFQSLVSAMLIKVTSFFRDPEVWEEVARDVLPRLLEHKQAVDDIRVWCAGCASGEEVYTVAMLIGDALPQGPGSVEVKVFGTDLDNAAIAAARRGIYTASQVEGIPKKLLVRWFLPVAEGFAVRQELRRMVVFGVNNLVSDAPISRLDMLVCRNVFIYLDAGLQKRVLARFHYALRQGGVLVLGKAELIPYAAKLFEPVDLARRIYAKERPHDGRGFQDQRLLELLAEVPAPAAPPASSSGRQPIVPLAGAARTLDQFHRALLGAVDVPVFATTPDGTVTFWGTAATRLWSKSEAEIVGRKLPALGLPGLPGDLLIEKTAAVREGRSAGESAAGAVPRGPNGAPRDINTTVSLLRVARDAQWLVYVVQDMTAQLEMQRELQRITGERAQAAQELQSSNEELQSSNEELETTNEELQSANEELQTTNEELQSTNEELETTNEELQSTNAELDTTNRELAARTDELNLLSLYQRTIIRSLAAAVVVLDNGGRITMWNLAAERHLGLAEGEAIGQLLWTLRVPSLTRTVTTRIRKALAQNLALRIDDLIYEVASGGRGHATVAAVPLIDGDRNLGAVVIFEDISRAVALAEENIRLKEKKG